MVSHGLSDFRINEFPRFVLLNTSCSNGSCPSGCIFVHAFNLIIIVAIWYKTHSQYCHCYICMQISEGGNFIRLIGGFPNFVLSWVYAFPFPLFTLFQLNTMRFYLVPYSVLWSWLNPHILILRFVFAIGWLLHHCLIEPCCSFIHNWTLLAVILP